MKPSSPNWHTIKLPPIQHTDVESSYSCLKYLLNLFVKCACIYVSSHEQSVEHKDSSSTRSADWDSLAKIARGKKRSQFERPNRFKVGNVK